MPKRDRGRKTLWIDRTIRAFGGNPTNRLVNVRNEKVQEALREALVHIQRLETVGLDKSVLQGRYNTIDGNRTTALQQTGNKAKCDALDPVKTAARQLATAAKDDADNRIGQLEDDLTQARRTISDEVDKAERLEFTACKKHVKLELQIVKDNRDKAEDKDTDVERLDALREVGSDLGRLKLLLEPVSKIESNYLLLDQNIRAINRSLPNLENKRDFEGRYGLLMQDNNDLPDGSNIDDMLEVSGDILAKMRILRREILEQSTAEGAIHKLDPTIDGVIEQAESYDYDLTKAVISVELNKVKVAKTDADLMDLHPDRMNVLNGIDLKPLRKLLSQCQDMASGLPRLLKGLDTIIGKLPNENTQKDSLREQLDELERQNTELADEDNLNEFKIKVASIKEAAETLMNAVILAAGGGKNNDLYKDVIKARFGVDIKITEHDGLAFNLKKTYEMLALVPQSHVAHEKLGSVVFEYDKDGTGSYSKSFLSINMGLSSDESGSSYIDPVTKEQLDLNHFNLTMVHEIGHAVDEKNRIMKGLMEKASYGNWKEESDTSVGDVLENASIQALKGVVGNDGIEQKHRDAVRPAIDGALKGTAATKPSTFSSGEWRALRKYTDIAYKIRESAKPWYNAQPNDIRIGDRVYIESYKNDWNSYDYNEQQNNSVSEYQWRAPAEWFAEIYAYCWFQQAAPPAGVGDEINKWLPEVEVN